MRWIQSERDKDRRGRPVSKAKKRIYAHKNRARVRELERAKRKANPERHRAYNNTYRVKNLERIRAWARRNYAKGKASQRERIKTDFVLKAKILVSAAQQKARKAGIPFSLTYQRVAKAFAVGVCEVTGLPFVFEPRQNGSPWVPSLDRTVPALGYTDENVKVVVWAYNAAKGVWTHGHVITLARALVASESS